MYVPAENETYKVWCTKKAPFRGGFVLLKSEGAVPSFLWLLRYLELKK
jgi:hypothetical protein